MEYIAVEDFGSAAPPKERQMLLDFISMSARPVHGADEIAELLALSLSLKLNLTVRKN